VQAKLHGLGTKGDALQGRGQPKGMQHARAIGTHLDTGADLAEPARALVDLDVEAGVAQR
jgi:hypothetical protein